MLLSLIGTTCPLNCSSRHLNRPRSLVDRKQIEEFCSQCAFPSCSLTNRFNRSQIGFRVDHKLNTWSGGRQTNLNRTPPLSQRKQTCVIGRTLCRRFRSESVNFTGRLRLALLLWCFESKQTRRVDGERRLLIELNSS
jgi:hypothetical protein